MLNSKIAKATSLQITEGLTVTVYLNSNYEFLISTKELAKAYGRPSVKIFDARERAIKKDMLIAGKHYLTSKMCSNLGLNIDERSIMWTLEGFFEIGNFLKVGNLDAIEKLKELYSIESEFLSYSENNTILSKETVNALLLEINKISDNNLRMNIANLLMGGR